MIERKILVLLNAGAGAGEGEDRLTEIATAFEAHGSKPDIVLVNTSADIQTKVKEAAKTYAVIVAAGGDGTISTVAGCLAGTDIALGVLPLGTLNHFAKDLQIPLELVEAVAAIMRGREMMVDLGKVNDRYFINNSSVGLYPHIVYHREKTKARYKNKLIAFMQTAIIVMRTYRLLKVRLTFNGTDLSAKTPFVFVGNGPYVLEGFELGSRERLDTGVLGFSVARRSTIPRLFMLLFHSLIGTLRRQPDYDEYETKELFLHSNKKLLRVAIDGEIVRLATPLRYQLQEKVLKVLVS